MARLAAAAVLALLTLALILVAVPLTGAYWFWVSDRGWSKPLTYVVFALPFVPLLAAAFALDQKDR